MIKILIRTIVFLVCLIFTACADIKQPHERDIDGLYVADAYYDCGTMRKSEDKKNTFSFLLQSRSDREIYIEKVDVSCGCMKIDKKPKTIAKGQSASLDGHVEISGQSGKLSKAIFVKFNNGKVLMLRVIGEVKE